MTYFDACITIASCYILYIILQYIRLPCGAAWKACRCSRISPRRPSPRCRGSPWGPPGSRATTRALCEAWPPVCSPRTGRAGCRASTFLPGQLSYERRYEGDLTSRAVSYTDRAFRRLEKLGIRSTDLLLRTNKQKMFPKIPKAAIVGIKIPSVQNWLILLIHSWLQSSAVHISPN